MVGATNIFKVSRLPDGYQEVAYIQNTNYYSIELASSSSFSLSQTYEVDIDFMIPSLRANGSSNNSGGIQTNEILTTQMITLVLYWASGKLSFNGESTESDPVISKDVKQSVVWNNSSNRILLNGSVVKTVDFTEYPDNWAYMATGLYVFGYNTSSWDPIEARIYSLIVKNHSGGTKVREYVPCYKVSNSMPGFYELVTGTFVQPESKNYFTVGPNA